MKSKLSRSRKPINLATLCRVNQRRQRWEVLGTIVMIMVMMLVAGFKRAGAVSR